MEIIEQFGFYSLSVSQGDRLRDTSCEPLKVESFHKVFEQY